ncbi:MAG: hypothetical protein H6625_10195 [Bdellovibrionaceae bacterium]|nr:hypothetical protein [Pseudobdellovibrionaceae bacterium]
MAFLFSFNAFADIYHTLARRVVVFPIQAESQFNEEAMEAWWKIRETLTEGKRFLVASKDFLERKDVFQARDKLSPADAIILGELLDSQLIITGQIKNKTLTLNVYESERGQLVWSQSSQMHRSLPLKDQIKKNSVELTSLLIAEIPYHGFVIKDELIGQSVYKKEGKVLVHLSVSTVSNVSVGDEVQLIKLFSRNLKPLFQGGAHIEIFAVGKILEIQNGIATAELLRITNLKEIQESTLVRFPTELRRIKEIYALKDSIKRRINPDYFSPEMTDINKEAQETQPLITAFAFLLNIATILLIAF